MQTISLAYPDKLPAVDRAVALGLFDGVHLGHRRVLMQAVGIEGLRAAVFSFGADAAALKPNAYALCTAGEKEHMFSSLGIDEWIQADFTSYREMLPQTFVLSVLRDQLHAKRVCCGFNFRFGKGGSGDVALLRALCEPLGIEVMVSEEVAVDGEPVSANRIRRLIEQGEIRQATRLLGHPFTLTLPVSHGQQLGRTLGSPTINQILPNGFVLPRFGVYTGTLLIDGNTYYGICNIGVRPTVGAPQPLCETWIEDFDGDLYDRSLPLTLTGFVRAERPFPSVEALKAQIVTDRDGARTARAENAVRALLFDFDDTLQDRRIAFLRYADWFLRKYAPALSDEERTQKANEIYRLNNGGYVDYPTFFTEMPRTLGIQDPPPSATLFAEYQRQFPRYATLFPDAVETLTALRARGYLLGIITNGPTVQQHRKIDFAGLRPLLDTVVVSMEEGIHKPAPEIFRRAAARLGLAAQQCVFVGDHPINDIEGAISSGMHPVFIDTRVSPPALPELPVIHTLSDLLTLYENGNEKK